MYMWRSVYGLQTRARIVTIELSACKCPSFVALCRWHAQQIVWHDGAQSPDAALHAVHAGVADRPSGRVYHMGAGDLYVHAFRRWLQLVAGGGSFGPQDAHWLKVKFCITCMSISCL